MSTINQTALAYYEKGVICYRKKDWDGAIANWTEAIRYQPDYISAIQDIGIVYREKGNVEAALKCLNKAIHFAPDKPSLYYNRALVYVDKNDFQQAIADYTQALTLDPKHPYAHCNRGGIYLRLGEAAKAQSDLKMALQLDPHDKLAQRGLEMANQMPDIDQIVSASLQGIQQGDLEKAWLLLQMAYNQGGKNNSKVHIGFGAIYDKQDIFFKAFAAFDYAVSCDPASPQAYNNRGRMSLLIGDLDSALADFKQTVRLQPDNARGYYNIGGVYLKRGQYQKAAACFNESMKLGYAPAKQTMLAAQKNIGATAPAGIQQNIFNPAAPDKKDFLQSILVLTKFAYQHCGPHLRLSLVKESSMFGLRTQEKTDTQKLWDVTVEDLYEFSASGYSGNCMGATLEIFASSGFLIRITRPFKENYELSLHLPQKLEGISEIGYIKQAAHTWLLPYEMLAPKLLELVETGVIKKDEHGLIYP